MKTQKASSSPEVASQIGEHYIFVKEERAERQLDRRATGWQTLALHVPAVWSWVSSLAFLCLFSHL